MALVLLAGWSVTTQAQVLRQITDAKSGRSGYSTLDDAGTAVWTTTCGDPFGTNPAHAFQLARWDAVTGLGEQVTSFGDGVGWMSSAVSISDDGQWIAFISPADLTGSNHDESAEIFVMRSDESQLTQVTSDPGPNAGFVYALAIAGSASRIVFTANTDPLGTNPEHRMQLFAVDRDGSNLHQLSNVMIAEDAAAFYGSISDDGQRVTFASKAQLVAGQNLDGGYEVFAVNANGTGLRQITKGATGGSTRPVIAGNGAKIAFESTSTLAQPNPLGLSHIYAVNWDGSGLTRLTPAPGAGQFLAAEFPSITDDAVFVVYSDELTDAVLNPEGNREIFKVRTDGTGRTALTHTPYPIRNRWPVISGSGNRIVYGREGERRAMDGTGGGEVLLEPAYATPAGYPISPEAVEITPDGTRIVFEAGSQIYRIQSDGSDLVALTNLTGGSAEDPSISGDGRTIAFYSAADPLGENPAGQDQIFVIQSDGTGLRQITHAEIYSEKSVTPVVATSAGLIVFQSTADLTGENPEWHAELFRARPDGSELAQITDDDGTDGYKFPRVDENGVWVAYQSSLDGDGLNPDQSFEILRIKTDGTSRQRITADPDYDSYVPDISGSGDRIVYTSEADPLGLNPDHNYEVFLYEVSSATRRQLTVTSGLHCQLPRISKDGQFVTFRTAAPVFEDDPIDRVDGYRVEVATGAIERIAGSRRGPSSLGSGNFYRDNWIAIDGSGRRHVLGAAAGDWAGTNPDYDRELYVADLAIAARVMPTQTSPTMVAWDPEPRGLRYDVVRGDVAQLALVGGAVDLGVVACLENDSPDTTTEGLGDIADPAPGQVFFFLHRASQGVLDGPGSYGRGSSGLTRVAGGGDCPL